jgi:formamidopyrimidine-DNA glycosylase
MPELPEVETIARELRPLLVGARVADVWFDWPNQIKRPAAEEFARAVRGRRIRAIHRRAKWLLLDLDNDEVLAIQVKMTGQLFVLPAETPRDKHVHAVLSLEDGREFRLRDTRKFARLGVFPRDDATLAAFGPEPLDEAFTPRDFARRLRSRRARLKTLLIDQAFIAGIGNIYADEALWRARLHPLRHADTVSAEQARRLYRALREVLAEAIERRGSSVDDYLPPQGPGTMQRFLNVYGRAGKPCPRCGRPIRRIVINARGTHYCSWCQRLPRGDRCLPRRYRRMAG